MKAAVLRSEDPADTARRLTGGTGVDLAVDSVGPPCPPPRRSLVVG